MNKPKVLAVTIVTAILFIVSAFPSYAASDASYWDYQAEGYLMPCPTYPSAESLPYGKDTEVYEALYYGNSSNEYIIFRCYLAPNTYSGNDISVFNGNSFLVVGDSSNNIQLFVTSTSSIYYQWNTLNRDTGQMSWGNILTANDVISSGSKIVNKFTDNNKYSSSYVKGRFVGSIRGTDECVYGGRNLKLLYSSGQMPSSPSNEVPLYSSTYWLRALSLTYITQADLSSKNIADAIDEGNAKVIAQIKEESNKQVTAINQAASRVEAAVSQGVSEIIGAGSDMPTLNTDNEWMNDSLTKVNGWLSELNDFEKQMDDAAADNAQNMEQAKSFISGFFGVVPAPIIAALTLILVVLVAVKLVGR